MHQSRRLRGVIPKGSHEKEAVAKGDGGRACLFRLTKRETLSMLAREGNGNHSTAHAVPRPFQRQPWGSVWRGVGG